MLTTIEGMYRGGKIELPELPCGIHEDTRELSGLKTEAVDLADRLETVVLMSKTQIQR